jgi:hypothetical protein
MGRFKLLMDDLINYEIKLQDDPIIHKETLVALGVGIGKKSAPPNLNKSIGHIPGAIGLADVDFKVRTTNLLVINITTYNITSNHVVVDQRLIFENE